LIEIDTMIDEREQDSLSNAFVREREREREREALIDIPFKIAHDLSIIPSSRSLVLAVSE